MMIYLALSFLAGLIVGFLISCRLFQAMQDDFFRAFGASPEGD